MPTLPMDAGQYSLVYNGLSFTFASMAASTMFFWLRLGSIHEQHKTAMTITGLVTFIAAYHYLRIFNSWVDAYEFKAGSADPVVTGQPFNDAYRYVDWLLTVPMLLAEIVFVMKLSDEEKSSKAWSLGAAAALMIVLGYPGELILNESELGTRWVYWTAAMVPFVYIVYTLLVGLQDAIKAEADAEVAKLLNMACLSTVISWCTYPVVYVLPMMGLSGSQAVVGIQLGYCVSDVIAKCGVGFLTYNITIAKTRAAGGAYAPLRG